MRFSALCKSQQVDNTHPARQPNLTVAIPPPPETARPLHPRPPLCYILLVADERKPPRPVEDDDSLLASVAGVPLTRSARAAVCLIWTTFWCARIFLTDAPLYITTGQLRPALLELLGENAFDQGFSICMAWLTVEVAIILANLLLTGVTMLIAKKAKPFWVQVAERLSVEDLEAILEIKRQKTNAAKPPPTGKNG